jgi:hypothetical protein
MHRLSANFAALWKSREWTVVKDGLLENGVSRSRSREDGCLMTAASADGGGWVVEMIVAIKDDTERDRPRGGRQFSDVFSAIGVVESKSVLVLYICGGEVT